MCLPRLELQQGYIRRDVLERGLDGEPDGRRGGLNADRIGKQPDAAVEPHLDHRVRHVETIEVGSVKNAPRLDDAGRRDRMPLGCLRAALRAEPRGGKPTSAAIPAALDAHLATAPRPPERLARSTHRRPEP